MNHKKTYSTWASEEQRLEIGTLPEVNAWLEAAAAAGKTDGLPYVDSSVNTYRHWVDQAAADEWISYVTGLTQERGYSVTFTVSDLLLNEAGNGPPV